jgi:hypothetical protein
MADVESKTQTLPEIGDGSNNSIEVSDTVGIVFLSFICILLLFALLRSQNRTRKILERQIEKLQK